MCLINHPQFYDIIFGEFSGPEYNASASWIFTRSTLTLAREISLDKDGKFSGHPKIIFGQKHSTKNTKIQSSCLSLAGNSKANSELKITHFPLFFMSNNYSKNIY